MNIKIIIFNLFLLIHVAVLGNDNISVLGSKTTITLGPKVSQERYTELPKNLFSKVLVDNNIVGYIPFNQNVGILRLRVFSPIKTKMLIKWDNADSLFARRHSKEIKFRRSGDYQSITFNAIKPMSGFIYLMSNEKTLIHKIRYTIKKQRKYSQSIRFHVRESDSSHGNNDKQSSSLSYSIGQRTSSGVGRWSGGVNFSEDSNSNKSISTSIGYSW